VHCRYTHTEAVHCQGVHLGVFHPCPLTIKGSWTPWGRVSKPLVSPLMPVPPFIAKMTIKSFRTAGAADANDLYLVPEQTFHCRKHLSQTPRLLPAHTTIQDVRWTVPAKQQTTNKTRANIYIQWNQTVIIIISFLHHQQGGYLVINSNRNVKYYIMHTQYT